MIQEFYFPAFVSSCLSGAVLSGLVLAGLLLSDLPLSGFVDAGLLLSGLPLSGFVDAGRLLSGFPELPGFGAVIMVSSGDPDGSAVMSGLFMLSFPTMTA